MLERGDQLSGVEPGRVLVQFTGRLFLNVRAQVTAGREFRHEVVHGSALQAGVKLNRYRFASIANRCIVARVGSRMRREDSASLGFLRPRAHGYRI